jgi:hypothetical protein
VFRRVGPFPCLWIGDRAGANGYDTCRLACLLVDLLVGYSLRPERRRSRTSTGKEKARDR